MHCYDKFFLSCSQLLAKKLSAKLVNIGEGGEEGGGVDCVSSRFVTFKNVRPRLGSSLKNPLNSRPRLPVELGV